MKKLLVLLLVLAVFCIGFTVFRSQISKKLIRQRAVSNFTQQLSEWSDDNRLHLVFLGTGTTAPEADIAQSGLALICNGEMILFDAGSGVARKAALLKLPLNQLKAIFYTHLHADHIADTGSLLDASWRNGRKDTLRIIGPVGTVQAANGFTAAMQAYYPQQAATTSREESLLLAPQGYEHRLTSDTIKPLFTTEAGLRVAAFRVEHVPGEPAFGYQISWKGRIITLSGDTRKNRNVERYARNADLLIHEAFNKAVVEQALTAVKDIPLKARDERKIQQARQTQQYHTTPLEAAQIAQAAGVKQLVFTHIIPPLGKGVARWLITEPLFLEGVDQIYQGEYQIAYDGLHLILEPKLASISQP